MVDRNFGGACTRMRCAQLAVTLSMGLFGSAVAYSQGLFIDGDDSSPGIYEIDVSNGDVLGGAATDGLDSEGFAPFGTETNSIVVGSGSVDPNTIIAGIYAGVGINGDGEPYPPENPGVLQAFGAIEALAYNVATGQTFLGDGSEFAMYSEATGLVYLDSEGCTIESMAADPINNLVYAGCDNNDLIYTYDPVTQVWSLAFDPIVDLDDGGMALDADNQILYFVEEDGRLHRFDLSTETGELIVDYEFDDSTSEVSATFLDAFIGDPAARVDSDQDGQPDHWEEGFAGSAVNPSLALDAFPHDAEDSRTIAITGAGWVMGTASFSAPNPVPEGLEFPYGVAAFCLSGGAPGSTATVSLDFGGSLAGTTIYKRDLLEPGLWSEFPGASVTGSVVTFSLTDGGLGDSDGLADGRICDPIGPGRPPGVEPIPVMSVWALAVLCLLMLCLGLGRFAYPR